MGKQFLISQLNNMKNPKRENRNYVANIVLEQPKLFKHLVNITFFVDNAVSIKAAWILEWICTHYNLEILLPHLNKFTKNIHLLTFDSAIRPCAKICEHLAVTYTSKENNIVKKSLTKTHIDLIIETGFDWLITPQKIAVRAYTMTTLYLFGLQKEWVLLELEHLISTKIIHESKGCKARGNYILGLIRKNRILNVKKL